MRLTTTKISLYQDVRLARIYLRNAEYAIAKGDWEDYGDIMEMVESLASASRCAARENAGAGE